MSFINLMADDVWSDADISNRTRAMVAGVVSEARQNELRTIMLGHLAQLRMATPEEMAEIMLVKTATEAAADEGRAARADMALLLAAMEVEQGGQSDDPAVLALAAERESLRKAAFDDYTAQP